MLVYDYVCEACDSSFEAFIRNEDKHGVMPCPYCQFPAKRITSGGNFKLPGHDTAFPTSADKWAKRHRMANREELIRLGQPV